MDIVLTHPLTMTLEGKTIFIGTHEIAGFLSRSATALAEHSGATVIAFKHSCNAYQPAPAAHPRIHWLFSRHVEWISGCNQMLQPILQAIVKIIAFLFVLRKANACLFIGGKGFFNQPLDYYLLRLCGKRVVHMYVGTASRPRYLSAYAERALSGNPSSGKRLIRRIKRQKRRVARISKAASCVIENPLCGHFQPRPFVNYFKLGMPININKAPVHGAMQPPSNGRKTRILHCPSQPKIKGTDRITSVLNGAELDRLNAELVVLTGVPHQQVIDEINRCDFVIDQLYSDSPLAGFAAEAASYGKVPVVGGYGWEELGETLTSNDIPPTALCHPDNLLQTVEALCGDAAARAQQSEALHTFLSEGEWSGRRFAEKLGAVLCGNVPDDWMVDPRSIRYRHGVGLSEEQAKAIAVQVNDAGGLAALGLRDNPQLEAEYPAWIG